MPRLKSNEADYLARYRADKSCFGGSLLRGNPKVRRPLRSDQALHVVLRASVARGRQSLLRGEHQERVKAIVIKQAARFGLRLYRYANSGNHLHLLVKPADHRSGYAGFVRAISGLIARIITGAERGRAKGKRFWDHRPFTRIVAWGKPFARCADYILKNIFEAEGFQALEWAQEEILLWRKFSWRPPFRPG